MEERIIGKWQEDGGPGTLEFFQDNTLLMVVGGNQISGRWLKAGEKRLKVDITMFNQVIGTTVMEITKLSGNKMEINRDGEVGKFTRVD
jgi:hypothetical protein